MFLTRGIVVRNDRLGADGFWMEIEAPDVAAVALPGQFVMVRCAEGLDPLTSRPFSVADVAGDRIALAYVVVGRGTSRLARMAPGTRTPLLGPLGRTFSYEAPARRHVMVAGGIGSAPFPLLARVLAETAPEAERILLLGGRSREHLYARDRFRELGVEVRIATDDGSEGHEGPVTDLLPPFLHDPGSRVYACGPTPMFRAIDGMLEGSPVPLEISVEPVMACGFGACYGCVVPKREGEGHVYVKACEEGPVFEIRDLVVALLDADRRRPHPAPPRCSPSPPRKG